MKDSQAWDVCILDVGPKAKLGRNKVVAPEPNPFLQYCPPINQSCPGVTSNHAGIFPRKLPTQVLAYYGVDWPLDV